MTKGLMDLSEMLFAQMEKLGDDHLTPDQLETELKRASAMVPLADLINSTAKIQIEATKVFGTFGAPVASMLPLIRKERDAAKLVEHQPSMVAKARP